MSAVPRGATSGLSEPDRTSMASERFETVLAAAQSGEESALAALYRQLQPPLLAYLRAQRPHEAEDVAAETWIAVAGGLSGFRGDEDDFRRWVFTIARRRLVDLVRREGRRVRTVPLDDASGEPPGHAADAATEVLESLATRRALELVAALPPGEAEVVLLRVVAGLSAQDVAAITGRSAGSVRVLQHRALRRLAALLSKTVVTLQSRFAL